ncbi:hypothetical protein BASA81_003171 [Batrachochytrium salamandrivorans]|nr:hypothetical protein BASA81_003171 [Batrachochytrium salamandrivorans]
MSSKRRLVVDDSSSEGEEEEEEEEVRRPVARPQRSSVKTYSSFKSSSNALEDVLQEEDVSLWKEEEEDERDRRVHFVVDDDGAGYADDDVDHKGKEYATMLSDDDEEEEAVGPASKARALQKKKPQQDLFSMFTKVERKKKTAAAASAEEEEVAPAPTGGLAQQLGEGEEEDTDALLALLSSKSSKSPASNNKRKPVIAKAPARISAVARKPVATALLATQTHEDENDGQDNGMMGEEMVFGDEQRPVSPPVLEKEPVEEQVLAPKLSTRSRLLAAAANRPAPAPTQVAPAPIAQEAELPEAAVPTGTFLPTTATSTLPPASMSNLVFPLLPSDTHKEAIEFYWTDIYETRPGELYLFGRVDVKEEEGSTGSCCVCLKHISRSLVVLPRHPCDTDESKRLVVDEVLNAVRQHRLERSALEGMRFKTKWVTKSYAFELPDIPRGESQYLLVEYSMYSERMGGAEDFPSSGTYYSHVFGTNQSTIERFLLSNKIMGPCWLRFDTNDKISREKTGTSHCKYEAELALSKLTVTANKPAPPVSVLSLALKTVVDPSTHQHQIVVATGVFHSRIPLDGASEVLDENAGQVRFQLVRPVLDGSGGQQRLDAFRNLKFTHPNVLFQPNERALLSCLMGLLHNLDADFLCGHNIEGFELDLLLSRLKAHNIKQWSKLGRLNLSRFPNSTRANGRQSHFGVLTPGRLIVDTYTSAQEFLLGQREYSLTALCESVGLLKTRRQDLDPSQVPAMFQSPQALVHLLNHNVETCMLQLKLAFKLEVFTLSLELTAIAGNLWRRTLGSGRAERIEYLLSHAFFNQDFIIPDKELGGRKKKLAGSKSNGPSYAGGLVLEPKPGLYDSYVVLLDFNALYPSIIQEYNICFTTVQRPAVVDSDKEEDSRKRAKAHDANGEEEEEVDGAGGGEEAEDEPALPSSSLNQPPEEVPLPVDNGRGPNGLAILPRVIQNIVDRRKQVQAQLKDESDVLKRRQLDTRQKALKITANSMYGCLGFASSRYFARPLASLITSQGRMILMDTVDTTERLGLKVLYGDTDSIMIDTQMANTGKLEVVSQVTKIADEIIKAVNPKYKYLKIALDGIFKTLLLLKKKKYASLKLVLSKLPGQIEVKRETKGLDLVRRDWCPASQRLGSDVLNLVLTGQQREEICDGIRAVLLDFKDKLPTLPLTEFTITKGLNKHPKDYPDNGKSNPHVQVAKRMLEKSKVVNVGDHIPFVICKATAEISGNMAQRAFHPDEVAEQNLEVDLDWYVSTQMFPPVQRLVEVMDGITPGEVAAALGMDASKFQQLVQHNSFQNDSQAAHFDSIFGQTFQADLDRFALCDKIALVCPQCQHAFDFAGVGRLPGAGEAESVMLSQGASCPQCGNQQVVDAFVLQNLLTLSARKAIGAFYHNQLVPKDAMVEAEFKTRQLGLRDYVPYNKRRIALKREVSPKQLWIQLYYLVCLVDCKRFDDQLARENDLRKKKGQSALVLDMTAQVRKDLGSVKDYLQRTFLHNSAFGWVEPELFQKAFRLSSTTGGAAAVGE